MRERYARFVRKTYRYFRHPQRRKNAVTGWISTRIFDRHLWRFEGKGVALGLGYGTFCALLPIPLQMILASCLCIWRRANIPVAVFACWLTPPVTPLVIVLPIQYSIGHWVIKSLGLPSSSVALHEAIVLNPNEQGFFKFREGVHLEPGDILKIIQESLFGVALTSILGGILAYWICRGCWWLFLRHRVKRWEQEHLERRKRHQLPR